MSASSAVAAPRIRSVALALAVAALCAAVTCGLLGLGALALGATSEFPPLQPFVAMPFAAVGTLAGVGGWALVVRSVRRSARVLRVLVPLALVVSWVPDAVLVITGFIPGATPLSVGALMLMHVVAAIAAVAAGRRIAPAQ